MNFGIKNLALGLVGGIAGGFLGLLICASLASQGLYAVAIPGAATGIGFAFAARQHHLVFGLICGVLGLLAGLITQWWVYSNEPSFFKLIGELKDYNHWTWILLGLGTVLGGFFGMGQKRIPHSVAKRPE